jgi:hypothetical protein
VIRRKECSQSTATCHWGGASHLFYVKCSYHIKRDNVGNKLFLLLLPLRHFEMLGLDNMQFLHGGIMLTLGHFAIVYFFKGKDRVVRRSQLLPALGVIAVMVAVKVGFEATSAPRNLYSVMGVERYSSPLQIRSSYKSISRALHPDKNPSPDAEAQFHEVKTAYDILMDEQQRDIYNRFGEGDLSFDPRMDELKLIGSTGAVYLFWVVCVYFVTMPKSSNVSRTWISIAGIAMLVVEVSLRLTESTVPAVPFLPATLTENVLIVFLHSIFPAVVLALRCVAEAYFVDVQQSSLEIMGKVLGQYDSINSMLDETLAALAGGGSSSGSTSSEDRLQRLQQAIASNSMETKAAIDRFKHASSDPFAGFYWLVIVGMYGAMYLASGE